MKELVLKPRDNKTEGGSTRRACTLVRTDDGRTVDESEIWFEHPETVRTVENEDCDSHLLATLMDAMREGRDVRVEGSVSPRLLSNLTEFQAAWNRWAPNLYGKVAVHPGRIREDRAPATGAVCAFSGGVDSLFTVWRHTRGEKNFDTVEIRLASLVHGFDIPLENGEEFDNAFRNAETTLKSLGLSVVPIRTNFRSFSKANWEHAHGAALTAALGCLKKEAGACLIAGGYPYDSLIIPWGSSPITDHLLGSDEFSVVHDGAAHDRVDKISAFSDWVEGVDNMRVCWEGFSKDRNCGKCEKCLRTMLSFLACGKPIPRAFPPTPNLVELVRGMIVKSQGSQNEWRRVLVHAEKNGVDEDWTRAVSRILRKSTFLTKLFPKESSRRKLASRVFRKIKAR